LIAGGTENAATAIENGYGMLVVKASADDPVGPNSIGNC